MRFLFFLKFREISILKYKSIQFIKVFLFLPGKNKKKQQIHILFKCKLYLVKSF